MAKTDRAFMCMQVAQLDISMQEQCSDLLLARFVEFMEGKDGKDGTEGKDGKF